MQDYTFNKQLADNTSGAYWGVCKDFGKPPIVIGLVNLQA